MRTLGTIWAHGDGQLGMVECGGAIIQLETIDPWPIEGLNARRINAVVSAHSLDERGDHAATALAMDVINMIIVRHLSRSETACALETTELFPKRQAPMTGGDIQTWEAFRPDSRMRNQKYDHGGIWLSCSLTPAAKDKGSTFASLYRPAPSAELRDKAFYEF